MVASFESKEERYNDAKPVNDIKQISRADGDRPEEINMVSKKNSFDGILVILENLVVAVTKTINAVNTISLFTDEKKLEEIKQKQQKQESREETNKVQTPEKVNKNTEQVNVTFVKKIDSSNKKNSTQSFLR